MLKCRVQTRSVKLMWRRPLSADSNAVPKHIWVNAHWPGGCTEHELIICYTASGLMHETWKLEPTLVTLELKCHNVDVPVENTLYALTSVRIKAMFEAISSPNTDQFQLFKLKCVVEVFASFFSTNFLKVSCPAGRLQSQMSQCYMNILSLFSETWTTSSELWFPCFLTRTVLGLLCYRR